MGFDRSTSNAVDTPSLSLLVSGWPVDSGPDGPVEAGKEPGILAVVPEAVGTTDGTGEPNRWPWPAKAREPVAAEGT